MKLIKWQVYSMERKKIAIRLLRCHVERLQLGYLTVVNITS